MQLLAPLVLAAAPALDDVTVTAQITGATLEVGAEASFDVRIQLPAGVVADRSGIPGFIVQLDVPNCVTLLGKQVTSARDLARNEFLMEPWERLVKGTEVRIPFVLTEPAAQRDTLGVTVIGYVASAPGDDDAFLRRRLELPLTGGGVAVPGDATNSRWGPDRQLLQIGDRAPGFRLPTLAGGELDLAEHLGRGNLVVTTYRAHWSPSCKAQLVELQGMYEQLSAANTAVVALSQEDTDLASARKFLEHGWRGAPPFAIAADLGRVATAAYDRTTAYLIDEEGVVRQVFPMLIHMRPTWRAILGEVRSGAGAAPAPERQFDFWVGDWTVTTQDGRPAGENTITLAHGGRVLQEEWRGAGGDTGSSLNMYDARDGRWHQTWMDSSGTRLDLAGGVVGEQMLMDGEQPAADGGTLRHRLTWTPLEGGRVSQVWVVSSDGGASWRTAVDLVYAPK
jgi:peroxiredoxin